MSYVSGDAASLFVGNTHAVGVEEEVLLVQNHFHNNSPNSSNTTHHSGSPTQENPPPKRKRNQPGNPDPNAEVVKLSPDELMATNRFVCEVCHKGFQRDQNLQLHRRGHNLPWKLKARASDEPPTKKVYVCPEPTCVHHNPQRALGDLTGIKKHYCRKHGEKKYRCEKCSKKYAVISDWKAHTKICGTKEYRCECGTVFSRKDSFESHRAFCDALTEENQRAGSNVELMGNLVSDDHPHDNLMSSLPIHSNSDENALTRQPMCYNKNQYSVEVNINSMAAAATGVAAGSMFASSSVGASLFGGVGGSAAATASMSATAMLQKAAQMAATGTSHEYGGTKSPLNLMMSNQSAAASMAAPPFLMQPLPEDHHHHQPDGGLVNMLLSKQKSPQQESSSHFLPTGITNAGGHDIGGFQKSFQLGLQDLASHSLMKKYGQDENVNNNYNMNNAKSFMPGATDPDSSSPSAAGTSGGSGGGPNSYVLPTGLPTRFGPDRTTVDFLGIGGPSRQRGISALKERGQDMNFNAGIGQPMMQGLIKQFEQQHAAMEKPAWQV